MMHVNYPGFSTFLLFFLFSSSIQSLPCHRAQHLCRHKNQNGSRLVCVFVCFVCVCVRTRMSLLQFLCWHLHLFIHVQSFFFPFFFFKCSIFEMCMFDLFSVFIYILCQYACFEHNESIKVFFFPSCLKNSSKKLVSAKNLLPQTPKQKRKKRGICEEKRK